MWDVTDPVAPVMLSETLGALPYGLPALAGDVLWVGVYNATASETTYDVSGPANPVLYRDDFWDGANAWNAHPCSTIQTGSVFVGDYLFSGRYEVFQRFDFSDCEYGPPVDPALIFADGFEAGDTGGWS